MNDSTKKTNRPLSKDIFPNEAWEMMSKKRKDDDLIIIDVCTPYEYKEKHLKNAINMNLFSRLFKARLRGMDKSATYVVYCKLGGRSKVAQKMMQRFGFQKVYNIIGGKLLWREEGLPFAPGADGGHNFSFCPFTIAVATFKKIKKLSHNLLSRMSQYKIFTSSVGHES